MSKIKLKKLSLNKQTIARLQDSQMQGVRGGRFSDGTWDDSCAKNSCHGSCPNNSCTKE